jgi:hypothetical protein
MKSLLTYPYLSFYLIVNTLFLLTSSYIPVEAKSSDYPYNNPAGCLTQAPASVDEMLNHVSVLMGKDFDLKAHQNFYVWNVFENTFINTTQDHFVREYDIDFAAPPQVYAADKIASAFQTSGFVVYLRKYSGHFRLLAIPMLNGVMETKWGKYVSTYWADAGSQPGMDRTLVPVRKKLPCQWVVDKGYVSAENLAKMFNFDWQLPDYVNEGQKYLAKNCKDTYAMAASIKNYNGKYATQDGSAMCGPLAWVIMNDANSFPYRIGSWYENPSGFVGTDPRSNQLPWSMFPPDTFDKRVETIPMNGYDFERFGNLYPGDIIFSYGAPFHTQGSDSFHHIFLVTAINADNSRLSISNLVRNYPFKGCSIEEIVLYTPGDRSNGFINHEWAGYGFGRTGYYGFDVFRWKWITYHNEGKERDYVVRVGDTLETIGFDWKVDPAQIAGWNHLQTGTQLAVGQTLTLPATDSLLKGDLIGYR